MQIDHVLDSLGGANGGIQVVMRGDREVVVVDPDAGTVTRSIESAPGVDRVLASTAPLRFVGREFQSEASVVKVGEVSIGDGGFAVIAGPCAVESKEQILATATAVRKSGAAILRGDAFKPRTSPYAFQGMGEEALGYLVEARARTGLPFVAEVLDPRHVARVAEVADMLRIGTRNMSNYELLKEVGRQPKPVLLKRSRTATVDEWLDAAEYVYDSGNHDVVLVERGIRTFETATRNTLDISAVPVLKAMTHLPVLVDPSHASGRADLVPALSLAALAVGADGILVDVHPDPMRALVDGAQALTIDAFGELMDDLARLGGAIRR